MLYGLFENILAKGGWQEFIPILVIGAIVVLKFIGKLISDKGEGADKQRPAQRPPSAQPNRRYAPMDEQGRVLRRPEPEPQQQRQVPAQRPIRRPDSVHGGPLAPAQAKLMPEHDHTLEFAARKKYRQEQLEKKNQRIAEQRRIAQQVRQRAAKAQEPAPTPDLEIIESEEPITLDNFTRHPHNLRTAFILSEVLGKPIAMRESPSTRIY